MENNAPIVLFVYNRAGHTKKTIEALKANSLAKESDLFIYSDAAKDGLKSDAVEEVRCLIKNINGFKSVKIIERECNYGLAKSIQMGVSEVIEIYGRVIVLEDDIVTSPSFLSFMNLSLDKFKKESKVWHVSGWNYLIDPEGLDDSFFWRVMNCWGWATWSDRWEHFDKSPETLKRTWKKSQIKEFNLNGNHNFWSQIEKNVTGEINTWAVFWYATIFINKGLCLNPTQSLVDNIGQDGSGENCAKGKKYKHRFIDTVPELPTVINENLVAKNKVIDFYKSTRPSLLIRVTKFIKRKLSNLSVTIR